MDTQILKGSVLEYYEQGNFERAMDIASKLGKLDAVKLLIGEGVDIDSAVREAAEAGHLDVVKYLVKEGASADLACVRAAARGQLGVLKYFLDIGLKDISLNTEALEKACENKQLGAAQMLLPYCDQEALDYAFIICSYYNAISIIKHMICTYDMNNEYIKDFLESEEEIRMREHIIEMLAIIPLRLQLQDTVESKTKSSLSKL